MPFVVPTVVSSGQGSLQRLPKVAARAAGEVPGRAMVVTDPGVDQTQHPGRVRDLLKRSGLDVVFWVDVEPNPRVATVDAIAGGIVSQRVDLVVGLGGGSVLDAAKAAAMVAVNGGSVRRFAGADRFDVRPLPFVAIPTTCGTGSEVTWVSVLTDEPDQRKISVKGTGMYPEAAIVDADLLETLPSDLVASTGLDALTHAVEAYTCRMANPLSDVMATQAIQVLLAHLLQATWSGAAGRTAREQTMLASTVAGFAFGNSDVAAVHCLSETIGGRWDTPHGLTNAVLLPHVLRYNVEDADCRQKLDGLGVELGVGNAEGFIAAVEELGDALDVPSFSSLGVPASADRWIAEVAVQNGSHESNVRALTAESYQEILRRCRQ